MRALEARTISRECVKIMNIGSIFLKLEKIKQATLVWRHWVEVRTMRLRG